LLTLRQIEVIRAIMVAGTVNGAAKLLNVSAPGVSRVMKHAETVLGVQLFSRRRGRYIPTAEAKGIIDQVNDIHRKVENLQHSIDSLKRGTAVVFSFASVPSISQFVMPRAIKRLSRKYPDLLMNIDILKIEEAVDYLLYRRGEVVAMSYRLDHPGMTFHPLAKGELVAIVAEDHPLADRSEVSVSELACHPLIGVDAHDPYGNIIARAFTDNGQPFDLRIKARFAHSVVSLVRQNLGIAVIDEFSVAAPTVQGIVRLPLVEPTEIEAYAAVNADAPESLFASETIRILREEMLASINNRPWRSELT
jgi:DNA-binding transcriptional LysR family regulator